jgi:hypothetical protein
MVRSLRLSGCCFAALLALAVSFASAASAEEFKTEAEPTYLAGSQTATTVLTVSGGTMKCKSTKFTGVLKSKSSPTLMVDPTFGECTAFGVAATTKSSGVHVGMTNVTRTVFGLFHHSEETDVTDTNGPLSVASAAGCELTIGEQKPKGKTEFEQQGTKATQDLLMTTELTGITYTSSGGACGKSGTNGTLTMSVLLKGYKNEADTEQSGIWIE